MRTIKEELAYKGYPNLFFTQIKKEEKNNQEKKLNLGNSIQKKYKGDDVMKSEYWIRRENGAKALQIILKELFNGRKMTLSDACKLVYNTNPKRISKDKKVLIKNLFQKLRRETDNIIICIGRRHWQLQENVKITMEELIKNLSEKALKSTAIYAILQKNINTSQEDKQKPFTIQVNEVQNLLESFNKESKVNEIEKSKEKEISLDSEISIIFEDDGITLEKDKKKIHIIPKSNKKVKIII